MSTGNEAALDPERQAEVDERRRLFVGDNPELEAIMADRLQPRPLEVPKRKGQESQFEIQKTRYIEPVMKLQRPLALYNGRGYAMARYRAQTITTARWSYVMEQLYTFDPPKVATRWDVVVVRDDGHTFGLNGDEPLTALDFEVAPFTMEVDRQQQWHYDSLTAFREGQRADPATVLGQLTDLFDHFVEFDERYGTQRQMAEALAVFTLSTWLAPAAGYLPGLWLVGEEAGATRAAKKLLAEFCYLGTMLSGPQGRAALNGIAECRATVIYATESDDPTEWGVSVRRPTRTLRLVTGLGMTARSEWNAETKSNQVRLWGNGSPRVIDASGPPSGQMAADHMSVWVAHPRGPERAKRDVCATAVWPHDPLKLRNDLWMLAVANLATVARLRWRASEEARLGPLEVGAWRVLMPVALWLDENGVPGLFERIQDLAEAAQAEQREAMRGGFRGLVVSAVVSLWEKAAATDYADMSSAEIVAEAKGLLEEGSEVSEKELTLQRVGRLMKKLGVRQAPRPFEGPRVRRWRVRREEAERWAERLLKGNAN